MPINSKTNGKILQRLSARILSDQLIERYRRSKNDFTRQRKMPFDKVVLFIMSLSRRSLQLDLTGFMRSWADGARNITASAFNQSRQKIDPLLFTDLRHILITEFYTDNDARVKRWNGLRLLATDGSTLALPQTPELARIYGHANNQHDTKVASGRCSVLYDVLNNLVLDGVLAPFLVGERELAMRHLHHCGKDDLVIYDRGYPGFELMVAVLAQGADFLMRCKSNHNNQVRAFLAGQLQDQTISIKPGRHISERDQELRVRMVKVLLDTGETEVLLTSLTDEQAYPTTVFKDLYYQRWGVEQFYNVVKNIVRVENFTGHLDTVLQQDFHCALLICNIHSLLVSEAQEELPAKHAGRKLSYKINNNISFGFLKQRIVQILADQDSQRMMVELNELFLSNTIPIRPGRRFPRNTSKYKTRKKPPYIQNSKPAL